MPGKEGIDFVIAPKAISDPELERKVYGAGDRVPMADAVKYGLVAGPKKEPAQPAPRGKRKAGASRARKGPEQDRARKPAEDR